MSVICLINNLENFALCLQQNSLQTDFPPHCFPSSVLGQPKELKFGCIAQTILEILPLIGPQQRSKEKRVKFPALHLFEKHESRCYVVM